MFFRREKVQGQTFSQRLPALREAGFEVEERPERNALVRRGGFAASIAGQNGEPVILKAGRISESGLQLLVSHGYQTVWRQESGEEYPARAKDLTSFHEFLEDLRYVLGLPGRYNEGLGTTHAKHVYDRLARSR